MTKRSTILRTLALLPAALPTMALAQTYPPAKTAAECPAVARAYAQAEYDAAMVQVRKDFAPGSPYYIAREKEARAFWLVQRQQSALEYCKAHFASGRTDPYRP